MIIIVQGEAVLINSQIIPMMFHWMEKEIKCSTTDPESGWFHKGEHKNVFAYGIETACDKNGWILDFTVHPGNEHDSRTFKSLYDKLKNTGMKTCIVDAGYKHLQSQRC